MIDPINKPCKWRTVLAGWHNGTQSLETQGCKAMRDLMEKWLIMRAETSAFAAILIEKKVFSAEEFRSAVHREAALLDKSMESMFPGFRTTEIGIQIYDLKLANETMRKLGFPP